MKKAILFLSAVFLTATYSCSQSNEANTDSTNADQPAIAFDNTEHDFGSVEWSGNGVHEFVFTNTGKAPLLLSNVRSSCGCTVPEWPKEPVKPGDKASIKVSYNTKLPGNFTKTITVYSNTADSPIVLRIKGNVGAKPVEPTEQ
jgi:hypothetical protein